MGKFIMPKRALVVSLLLLFSSSLQADYIWSEAVPTALRMIPGGLVLEGAFDQTGVTCATAPSSVFLPNTDPQFDAKLSMALTAYASGSKIRVLLETINPTCHTVSAMGNVPIVHYYYWRMQD